MEDTYSTRKGKKCVIYIRVSSERQVQGYSLEGQKRFLKEWAEFEGMTVSEIYVEPGKSGKSITGREVFQKMLNEISSGSVETDYVLVFKLSRFGRNAKDILNSLTYIQRYGVNLICKELPASKPGRWRRESAVSDDPNRSQLFLLRCRQSCWLQ